MRVRASDDQRRPESAPKMGRSAHSRRGRCGIALAMGRKPRDDLRSTVLSWFSDDELKLCPHCGERAAVPSEPGPSVCLRCEVVWIERPGRAPERAS